MKRIVIIVLASLLVASNSMALTYPKAKHKAEYSLRDTNYSPDNIVFLRLAVGYATTIVLQKGESLEDWSSGDSGAFELSSHKNMVSIKPKVIKSNSNIFIYSNRGRVYNFKVEIAEKDPYYSVRFSYPEDDARKAEELAKKQGIMDALASSTNPDTQDHGRDSIDSIVDPDTQDHRNYAYIANGSTEIRPIRVFDNGQHTFFRFAEGQDFPSIFRLTANGEEMIQHHTKDNWIIVPRVETEWMLRLGTLVTCVRNDKFKPEIENHTSTASDEVFLTVKPLAEPDDGQ